MKISNSVNPKSSEATKLAAPWDVLFNKISATIGADPTIRVQMISLSDTSKVIQIGVPEYNKARYLATLLIREYCFGDVSVKVEVHMDDGDFDEPVDPIILPDNIPANLASLVILEAAFQGNPFYYVSFPPCMLSADEIPCALKSKLAQDKCKTTPYLPNEACLVVVFRKVVVNYCSDDIKDFFLSTNEVPSVAFGSILNNVLFGKCTLTYTQFPKLGIDNE